MAKCNVNKDLCISCGMCTAIAASAFAFGDDGKAECILDDAEVTADVEDSVQEAAISCPVQAIEVA